MSVTYYPGRSNFGLLPEPEGRTRSFITSMVVNMLVLLLLLWIGTMVRNVIEVHRYEQTELIVPSTPPPPQVKVKIPPPPPQIDTPKLPEVKLDAPKILMPKPKLEPKLPDVKMEAKLALPTVKAAKPSIILAPQPKAALTAAMPAQDNSQKPSTKPVHFGDTFGVKPNPNGAKPATIAAIGNPYGGMNGPAVAPHGVVGSTGIGNGTRSGSNSGVVGKVASAGIPGGSGSAPSGAYGGGKVASAGIPATTVAAAPVQMASAAPSSTDLEVLSKPSVQYTSEARQMKVQGDVVLRVTFTAAGRVLVQGLVHGLGHGLDEEARRVAQQIRFRPATRNGQAVDLTTNITISFQLA